MKKHSNFIVTLIILLCFSSNTDAQLIYGTFQSSIFRFDILDCTGSIEYLNLQNPPSSNITDIAFHPNGKLYVTTQYTLYHVDYINNCFKTIGDFDSGNHRINSLVAHSNGKLYGAGGEQNSFTGHLYEVSVVTGKITILGSLPELPAGDMAFFEGKLYMTSINQNLIKIDLDSPENSQIQGNLGAGSPFFGIVAVAADCEDNILLGCSSNSLYEIDPNNASKTAYCELAQTMAGLTMVSDYLSSDCCILTLQSDVASSNCTPENVKLKAIVSGGNPPFEYSIDGVNYQTSSEFLDINPGSYTIYVRDIDNCIAIDEVNVSQMLQVAITEIQKTEATCDINNGSILVDVSGGEPPYKYSLDNINYQNASEFTDLAPRDYSIYVQDNNSCLSMKETSLGAIEIINITNISIIDGVCGYGNGLISIELEGGIAPYSYALNGSNFQDSSSFHQLTTGNHQVSVRDESGCLKSSIVELDCNSQMERCPTYVPNIFSPNQDGLNDVFDIYTESAIEEINIFNRWGQNVYSASANSGNWDGKVKGNDAPIGVYLYSITVTCEGRTMHLKGDLSLVR